MALKCLCFSCLGGGELQAPWNCTHAKQAAHCTDGIVVLEEITAAPAAHPTLKRLTTGGTASLGLLLQQKQSSAKGCVPSCTW